ncbi:hypothetical protein MIND_00943000 [Mycena indigotica]|uniref:VWFA domain-containing protein n=1 Tax=Mycena indigotica TaxID=2126181 RepID=A0A8H6SE70_9AGAR|nr:uncharacterized protein MIND_00943000 [Mycena indigotica]KAF7297101.1 hypothetical protein MIND_00943000 [Mycena indigotica]
MPSFLSAFFFGHRRSRSADTRRLSREPPPSYNDSLAVPDASLKRSTSSRESKYDNPQWLRQPMRQSTLEDALELLVKYDTVILVDDSGSMQLSSSHGKTRWQEAGDALAQLATTAAQYDADGIDIHFLNHVHMQNSSQHLRTAEAVRRVFNEVSPRGPTPTGDRLDQLLKPYISMLEEAKIDADGTPRNRQTNEKIKRVNFIVITDGQPTDEPSEVIVHAAKRFGAIRNICPIQVGIQFVQIGDDPNATAALSRLDDDLAQENGIPDIVDTTPYTKLHPITADGIIKCLIGGINRRVDKQPWNSTAVSTEQMPKWIGEHLSRLA